MGTSSNNFGLTGPERIGASISRMNSLRAAIMQSIRVAVPAVVQAQQDGSGFSPGPPATVILQVALKEYVQQSSLDGPFNPTTQIVALPLLYDVPVVIPTAGGWSLTLPIQVGDECMAVFSDAALDSWLQAGGTDNAPISQRRHSLSDAMAVFGLRSTPNGLQNYSLDSAQLRNDDSSVVIDLADGQITVTAPSVTVYAATVKLGSELSHADFMPHQHYNAAGPVTGTVVPQP